MASAEPPEMTTLQSIEAELKLIETKKENLKKAYEELQCHSSLLPSFSLSWSELNSHFTAIEKSLMQRFHLLQSLESGPNSGEPVLVTVGPNESGSNDSVTARPELRELCEKMDGNALRDFVIEHAKERNAIKQELVDAIKCAPDPGALILEAMEVTVRKEFIILLEILTELKPELSDDVRERAKNLSLEWKESLNLKGENLETLGFLNLVAAYRLGSEFSVDEHVEYLVALAPGRYREAARVARALGLGDKVTDLIQKLIDRNKLLVAIKFIYEFELTDKFSPVTLLKSHVKESQKLAKKICKDGHNSLRAQNEATAKEVGALRSVIKVIEDRNLKSEYPPEDLEKRIEELEKERVSRKRPAGTSASKFQKQQNQSGNKLPRADPPVAPRNVPSYQQSHLEIAGFYPNHHPRYMTSVAGPYDLTGSAPTAAPYTGTSAGLYALAGGPVDFHGNPSHVSSQVQLSEAYVSSGQRPAAYSGYPAPPQYNVAYYPQ